MPKHCYAFINKLIPSLPLSVPLVSNPLNFDIVSRELRDRTTISRRQDYNSLNLRKGGDDGSYDKIPPSQIFNNSYIKKIVCGEISNP